VKQGDQVVGILEVFSQNPSTFTDRHLEVLRQLSELVIAEAEIDQAEVESPPEVSSAATVPQPRLLPAKAPEESPVAAATVAPALALESEKLPRTALTATLPADVNISAYMAAHEKAQSQGPPRIPKIVLVGLATIVLASFVGWYLGHRSPSATVTTAAATLANAAPSTTTTPPAVSEIKPSPGVSSTTNDSQDRSRPASDSLTNAASKNRIANNSVSTNPISVVPNPPAVAAESDTAPGLPVAAGDATPSNPVSDLLNTPTALPVRAAPVSQGVEGGELESQVNAIYPQQARAMRQHGTVVLEALVGTDGSVKDVKVVSGPPLLRQSAMDAVRRWKYQPFRLNGKRIAAQTQVQVDFKLQ